MAGNKLHHEKLDLDDCLRHARLAALGAWDAITHFFQGDFKVFEKEDKSHATEADIAADHFIVDYLRDHFPGDEFGFLSEETQQGAERFESRYCWIIDPIDGTSDFMRGGDDFAVHIGLAEYDSDLGYAVPIVGVVYQPRPGWLASGATGKGAFIEHMGTGELEQLHVSSVDDRAKSRLVTTNNHYGRKTDAAIRRINPAEVQRRGSLGVKVVEVARGASDLYLNFGRRMAKEWDVCAPHAILLEAGGRLTDLRGEPVGYLDRDYHMDWGLIVSNGVLHDEIRDLMANVPEIWD